MTIEQRNLYLPGQNLTNLALNTDYNRIGDDKSEISVNFGTSPATVTIKAGSLIEVNGNLYAITADETFQMSNATHSYIGFDGSTFTSHANIGTYSAAKGGYYQTGNVIRTLKFYVDQPYSLYYVQQNILDKSDIVQIRDLKLENFYEKSIIYVEKTTNQTIVAGTNIIQFNNVIVNSLSEYNNSTYIFTAKYTGKYRINTDYTIEGPVSSAFSVILSIYNITTASNLKSTDSFEYNMTLPNIRNQNLSQNIICNLNAGDQIQFRATGATNTVIRGFTYTSFAIERIY